MRSHSRKRLGSSGFPKKYCLGDVRKKGNVTRENPFPSSQWWKGPFPGPAQNLGLLRAPPTALRPAPRQGSGLLLLCPPSCLLPSSSANDRGGCQLACCLLVQQQLFIYPFAMCRFWAQCYRGNKTNRERGSGRDSRLLPGGRGRGQEGLLHIRVVAGVLDAARVKLRQEADEEASHMESHGKRVPGYETTAPNPVWTGDLA